MNRQIESDVERYLAGEMDKAEALRFRQRIDEDPARASLLERDEAILRAMKSDRDHASQDHVGARARAMESLKNATAIAHAEHARQMRNTSAFILVALMGVVAIGAAVLWWAVGEPAPIDESPSVIRMVDSTEVQAPVSRNDSIATSTPLPAPAAADEAGGGNTRSAHESRDAPPTASQANRAATKPRDESAVQSPGPPSVPVYDDPVARGSINQRDEAK